MAKTGKYIAVYDVSKDRERERVSTVLEGFGTRVQFSVFECLLSPTRLAQLTEKLNSLELESGSVLLYRLLANARPLHFGTAPPPQPDDEDDDTYAFVS